MTVNSATAEGARKPAADPGREPIPRYVYLAMRLEEISTHVAEMAKEREKLTAELMASPSGPGARHKQLRQRRAYLAERLAIVREEQALLKTERKTLGVASPQRSARSTS